MFDSFEGVLFLFCKEDILLKNQLENHHFTINIRATVSELMSDKGIFCSAMLDGLDKCNVLTTFVLNKPSRLEKIKVSLGKLLNLNDIITNNT